MSSSTPADRNRRVFFRLPIQLPVRYRLQGDDTGPWLRGTTLNLSAGGLLLQGPMLDDSQQDALLMGYRQLECRLDLPTGKTLELQGTAAWMETSDESGGLLTIGVEFLQLAASIREDLHGFVQACCDSNRTAVE